MSVNTRRDHDGGHDRRDPNCIDSGWISIHCDDCPQRPHFGYGTCADCPVSYVAGRDADDAVIIDVTEERALRILENAGILDAVVARNVDVGAPAAAVDDGAGTGDVPATRGDARVHVA